MISGFFNLDNQVSKAIFRLFLLIFIFNFTATRIQAQHSVARKWNDVLLQAIREDFARPTVHSRNLFHISTAMYDAWAAYDDVASTYFLGNRIGEYSFFFAGVSRPTDVNSAQEEAISFAAYRILKHRFSKSPNTAITLGRFDSLFVALGYDSTVVSIDYKTGLPAALGNFIAAKIIEFGFQDGANEQNEYANHYYTTVNPPIAPAIPGNPDITDPNRWQPITLEFFIDQSGNLIPGATQPFLGPEWGNVIPFALTSADMTSYMRDGSEYKVYHDPEAPPYILADGSGLTAEYLWGFTLVAKWSAHLDPADNVMIDISPASIGNILSYPTTIEGLRDFYDEVNGGDLGIGHNLNPVTGIPYATQMVPRGDYARVLAEFWADGPDSETPPGHWFTILNYVNDHPDFEKRYKGEGPILAELEWDVKAYLALAGAVHDAAVSAWGIKGWYDYIRPVSSIRYIADKGQSTNPMDANYSPEGIPLTPGLVEVVETGDALAGVSDEHVGKIKLYSWKGPDFINNPLTDVAGVGWILAENWWPYQRPSFVTPPFAGYLSGHSTFSRAAAEVMTKLTGNPFFPAGIGEFTAKANEFLVFEDGPSVDVVLQWATYRDASDQTSLSRIWGGIHPPADDIPGRLIGEKIGLAAFDLADQYFNGVITALEDEVTWKRSIQVYPNPVNAGGDIYIRIQAANQLSKIEILNVQGVKIVELNPVKGNDDVMIFNTAQLKPGLYLMKILSGKGNSFVSVTKKIILK